MDGTQVNEYHRRLIDEVGYDPIDLMYPTGRRGFDMFKRTPDGRPAVPTRYEMTHRYAWAIPSDEAIEAIAAYSPLVEMGAGTGYWASLLAAAGADIVCYDANPPVTDAVARRRLSSGPIHSAGRPWHPNHWHQDAKPWHPVRVGTPDILAGVEPTRTLLLCWPPYAESMAHDSLLAYRGVRVVYVGECEGGCTGDDAFHALLAKEWTEETTLSIPRWSGIGDEVVVYVRSES
jgi:hypothetical protein